MVYYAGPFDQPHIYLQWGGKLPGGESWSCGLRFRNAAPGGPELATTETVPAAITAAVQAFHTRPGSMISQFAKLSFVKFNLITMDGKYANPLTGQAILADIGGGGTATTPYHPNQVALAISLTTGFTRGPAHRGRFYMPLPNTALAVDGLVSATDRDSVKASALTFVAALNAVSANAQIAVFSRKIGAATNRMVTGVAVGRALDTQRRRRRALVENY